MNDLDQLYRVALARELRDGDYVHVGASQPVVWIAAQIARRLWAPTLRANAGGRPLLTDDDWAGQPTISYDRDSNARRSATLHQSRIFDDLRRERVVFAGALQVDRIGNANLIGVGEGDRVRLWGPGSAGLTTLTSHSSRFFLALPRHDPRTLVERVAAISVLGSPPARREVGYPPYGLVAVITPLARFEPTEDGLVLTEISPGVELAEVRRRTGFPVTVAGQLRQRPPLTPEELAALHACEREGDRRV